MLRVSPLEDYGIVSDPTLPTEISFQKGAKIARPLPEPLVFPVNTTREHPPTDCMGIVIPVFSDRLVGTLEDLGVDNLQRFNATLQNPDTSQTWEGWKAVNVVGLVSCLAVEESKAKEELPPLYSFQLSELVIHEERAAGKLLFRLAEAPRVILVDGKVGDFIMDAKPEFRGLEFRDVQTV